MGDLVGVVAALAAGAFFAAGGVLQQRVAARAERRANAARLVVALARRPQWLAGIAFAAASNGLEGLALAVSPLAVVQPLLVSELVFAIPVSARLAGVRLGRREWCGLLAVSAGLAATLWGAAPSGGVAGGGTVRWLAVGGGLAAGAVLLTAIGRRRSALVRASCYAAAAALVFAVSSAFMAATVRGFAAAGLDGFARPAPYAMTVASITGLLLIQSAYQAGPLAVTMPMVDWVEPLVAVVLGVSVLGESLDTAPTHLAALALGALGALAGILALDTSPRVRRMHERQRPAPSPSVAAGTAVADARAHDRRAPDPLPTPATVRARVVAPATCTAVGRGGCGS